MAYAHVSEELARGDAVKIRYLPTIHWVAFGLLLFALAACASGKEAVQSVPRAKPSPGINVSEKNHDLVDPQTKEDVRDVALQLVELDKLGAIAENSEPADKLIAGLRDRRGYKSIIYLAQFLNQEDTPWYRPELARAIRDRATLNLPLTPIKPPAYVTAWPKQVPVLKPDPVLGDKPFWEYWVYSKDFAKRFKGFPTEGAEPQLPKSIHAFVFRVHKENLWKSVSSDYPKQYKCEWDVYANSDIPFPFYESTASAPEYPKGVSPSYRRLEPFDVRDSASIQALTKVRRFAVERSVFIFADKPLDGRYASFGIRQFYRDFVPGLSVVVLAASVSCAAMAPIPDGGIHWLSLFGNRPYHDDAALQTTKALSSGFLQNMKSKFNPGQHPEKDGYFRVPEAFYRAVLPKVTLVKAINACVNYRHAYTLPNKGTPEKWAKLFGACKEIEELGVIYDLVHGSVFYGEPVKALRETGF